MKETTVDSAIKEMSVVFPSPADVQEIPLSPEKGDGAFLRTYQLTRWPLVNHALDMVDRRLGGKAGYVQRLVSYLFLGGLAALVNLIVFDLIFSFLHLPFDLSTQARNMLASICAAECSVMTNFLLNDHFTFRYLPGARRPWPQRCLRFHATCLVGSLLTFVLEFSFFSLAHVPALFAEMIAIVLVLIYNFTFHHIFTYRSARHS
jgi:putative flippase GtrA